MGCYVTLQRDPANDATKRQIEALGRKVSVYKADLSRKEDVSGLVTRVLADGHDVDILLNCAGIQRRHPSHVFPDGEWDEVCTSYLFIYIYIFAEVL